ncbi:unnamed protein product [Arabidopsis halleri]
MMLHRLLNRMAFLMDLLEDVCIETEKLLKHCKLITVYAGIEKGNNVEEQLNILRAKDTSIPKIQPLTGRKTVWDIPQLAATTGNFTLMA